jgi:hypothetical protein
MGIAHSHPVGFTVPSAQDRIAAYNNITSPANGHLLTWHMPIIQSKADVGEFGFFPYIVSCQGPGRTRIHKPRLEIIGKSRYVQGCSLTTNSRSLNTRSRARHYHDLLGSRYRRISNNVDFDTLLNTSFFVVGVGASSGLVAKIARLGGKRFYLFDNDRVETKNLATQDFDRGDVGKLKVEALKARLQKIELESGNPDVPSLTVETGGDFMALSDPEIGALIDTEKAQGRKVMLIFATDFHPAQARGSRLAIQHKVPAFWVGVYRAGGAGEIVFWQPNADLPCYRCITQSRYDHFNATKPSQRTASVSSGLPFATELVDALLGHLIIGAIHRKDAANPHGRLFNRLVREKRNFIQIQMDPDYRMGGEDLFAGISGRDIVTFNTLFQADGKKHDCADCGAGAAWDHTNYLCGHGESNDR